MESQVRCQASVPDPRLEAEKLSGRPNDLAVRSEREMSGVPLTSALPALSAAFGGSKSSSGLKARASDESLASSAARAARAHEVGSGLVCAAGDRKGVRVANGFAALAFAKTLTPRRTGTGGARGGAHGSLGSPRDLAYSTDIDPTTNYALGDRTVLLMIALPSDGHEADPPPLGYGTGNILSIFEGSAKDYYQKVNELRRHSIFEIAFRLSYQ